MTTTINASTSSGLVVTPDNSGNVLLQYNGVAAPAFSVSNNGTQAISSDTSTVIVFNTEAFDTNNNFASNRFTPTVAGYYQLSSSVYWGSGTGAFVNLYVNKNGSGLMELARASGSSGVIGGSALVYCNGTTDYIQLIWYSASGTCTLGYSASASINFSGCLLRGA